MFYLGSFLLICYVQNMMNKPVIVENYRDDAVLREAFFGFLGQVFPRADFREWFRRGFWQDEYVPISVVDEGKIVSNVSMTGMKIWLDGQLVPGIQIGTVGTVPDYRGRGLARLLMDHVLGKCDDSARLLFLFANDSVLDFYPRFGFHRFTESVFEARPAFPRAQRTARRLDISVEADIAIVKDLLGSRFTLTRLFGAAEYEFITWWHILNGFDKNLFYSEDDDVILVMTETDQCLHVWDVVGRQPFDLTAAIRKVALCDGVKAVHYHFPPDQLPFEYDRVTAYDDSMLFVRGDFGMAGKRFRFPTTAQT